MGSGRHLRVAHSLPCTNPPVIWPPRRQLFIQQAPRRDLSLSTLNVSSSGDFSGATFISICYFFLFLGNVKRSYSVFLRSSCPQALQLSVVR